MSAFEIPRKMIMVIALGELLVIALLVISFTLQGPAKSTSFVGNKKVLNLTQWNKRPFSAVSPEPENDQGAGVTVDQREDNRSTTSVTWKENTFCHDFLVNTFSEGIPTCGGKEIGKADQVKCYGSPFTKMVRCEYANLIMRPELIKSVAKNIDRWKNPAVRSINLLDSTSAECKSPSMEYLRKKAILGDFETKLTQHLLDSERLPSSECDIWINKTTFVHISNGIHVYFRFLDAYNVHKALLDYKVGNDYQVLRMGYLNSTYNFPEFDKALFPGALTTNDLQGIGKLCFKKMVFVPIGYQSTPFCCKMNRLLKQRCFECSGRGHTGSTLHSFRRRVLHACNITESDYCRPGKRYYNITIISRKPYKRWPKDYKAKFRRVLENEDEMVSEVSKSFPDAVVRAVHMEELDMCEQVRHAVEADVLLGVHGAGLVHFWWLREGAVGFELEPSFETSNPSFRMLTTLAGRKYVAEMVRGPPSSVVVNMQKLIQSLKQILNEMRL